MCLEVKREWKEREISRISIACLAYAKHQADILHPQRGFSDTASCPLGEFEGASVVDVFSREREREAYRLREEKGRERKIEEGGF